MTRTPGTLVVIAAGCLVAASGPALCQSPAVDSAGADRDLQRLEMRFEARRAAALRSVLARYVDGLIELQATLLDSGETAGASRVQLEIERIRPAVRPALPRPDGDHDRDLFTTPDSTPAPKLDPAAPLDLNRLVEAMLAPPPSAGASPSASRPPGPDRPSRKVLKMTGATLASGTSRSAESLGFYWAVPNRSASWTVTDMPAGSYRVTLRYSGSDDTGGKIRLRIGDHSGEVKIEPLPSGRRIVERELGPFRLTDGHFDLVIQSLELEEGAGVLFQLESVTIAPARDR